MSPDQFARAGQLLYGNDERCYTRFRAALEVGGWTYQQWLTGDPPVPDNLAAQLRLALELRATEIVQLHDELG
jgi:hypothetical protein